MLLLVKDTRQQQAALQDGNLLFNIAFRLQRPLQPVFDFNVLLHQLITVFSRGNQTLTQLLVNFQFLLHQRISLNTRGFIRGDGFLRRFFG